MFIIDGLKWDYPFEESILSMKEHCDEIVVVDAGSKDGTAQVLKKLEDAKTKVIYLDRAEWEEQKGWQKLNYFSNKAIAELTTEWNFMQQSDEILHQNCYKAVRDAIDSGKANGYSCARFNLWASPYKMLNVVGNRNPCSTKVVRLAKSQYMTYGDAESIACDDVSNDYTNQIRLYHMGFVRSKEVHAEKIRNMQANVFQVTPDAKLDGMTTFAPYKWFSEDDLIPIPEPLPRIIQDWARQRE
jgi:glycosyltransferase involved in cell wall biosynthesis